MFSAAAYVFSDRTKATTFSTLDSKEIGNAYVAGYYEGLFARWSVLFFHRDTNGNWVGYYLAHESGRWNNAKMNTDGEKIFIERDAKRMGTYDLRSKLFTHGPSGVTFPKEEGLVKEKDLQQFGLIKNE